MTAAVAYTHGGGHNPSADRTQPVKIASTPFVPPAALYRVPATELLPTPISVGHTTPPWTQTAWAQSLELQAAPRDAGIRKALLVLLTLAVLGAAVAAVLLFVL